MAIIRLQSQLPGTHGLSCRTGPLCPCSSRAGWAPGKEGGLAREGSVAMPGAARPQPLGPFLLLAESSGFHPASKGHQSAEQKAALSSNSAERMERGRVAAPSSAAIAARLEPGLAAPCRARSSQHGPGASDGAQRNRGGSRGPGSVPPPEPAWILGTKKPAFETRQNCPALCKAEAAGSTN